MAAPTMILWLEQKRQTRMQRSCESDAYNDTFLSMYNRCIVPYLIGFLHKVSEVNLLTSSGEVFVVGTRVHYYYYYCYYYYYYYYY